MSTLPADAVSAAARFVLLRDLPLLVVDLEPPPAAAEEPLASETDETDVGEPESTEIPEVFDRRKKQAAG